MDDSPLPGVAKIAPPHTTPTPHPTALGLLKIAPTNAECNTTSCGFRLFFPVMVVWYIQRMKNDAAVTSSISEMLQKNWLQNREIIKCYSPNKLIITSTD
jgi:hypothetical protein